MILHVRDWNKLSREIWKNKKREYSLFIKIQMGKTSWMRWVLFIVSCLKCFWRSLPLSALCSGYVPAEHLVSYVPVVLLSLWLFSFHGSRFWKTYSFYILNNLLFHPCPFNHAPPDFRSDSKWYRKEKGPSINLVFQADTPSASSGAPVSGGFQGLLASLSNEKSQELNLWCSLRRQLPSTSVMTFISSSIPGCFHISFFFHCTFQYFCLSIIQQLPLCKISQTKSLCDILWFCRICAWQASRVILNCREVSKSQENNLKLSPNWYLEIMVICSSLK